MNDVTGKTFEEAVEEDTFLNQVEEKLRQNKPLTKEERERLSLRVGRPDSSFHQRLNEVYQNLDYKEDVCPLCEGAGIVRNLSIPEGEACHFFYDLLFQVMAHKPDGISLCVSEGDLYVIETAVANKPIDPKDFVFKLEKVVDFTLSALEASPQKETAE